MGNKHSGLPGGSRKFQGTGQASGYRPQDPASQRTGNAALDAASNRVTAAQSRGTTGPPRFNGGGVALGSRPPPGQAVATPPSEEQQAIKAYIEAQLRDMDALIASVQKIRHQVPSSGMKPELLIFLTWRAQDAPPDVLVPALELLSKIYGAIIDKPNEPKVRKIRTSNQKFVDHLGGLPVAMDFLEASGFVITIMPVENGVGEEECVLFPNDAPIPLLQQARNRLNTVLNREKPKLSAAAVAAAERASSQSTKPAPHARTGPQEQVQVQSELADMLGEPAQTPPTERLLVDEAVQFDCKEQGEKERGVSDDVKIEQLHALIGTLKGADLSLLKPALELTVKIATAIIQEPGNPKVRSIKRRGAAFQKIEIFESMMHIFEVVGFQFVVQNGEESVVFPAKASQYILSEMKGLMELELKRICPQPAEEQQDRVEMNRETAVFFRVEGGPDPSRIDVPDSYFEFTGSDLRNAQVSHIPKNQFMTKAMREAGKPKYKFCLIRIRFTDGFILQGKFRSGETMGVVKKWLESCINTPDRHYYLSTIPPVRKVTDPVSMGKSLAELEMVPATLLNFFWADGFNEGTHMLKKDLAAVAVPLTLAATALPQAEAGQTLGQARPVTPQQLGGTWGPQAGASAGGSSVGGSGDKIPKWLPQKK